MNRFLFVLGTRLLVGCLVLVFLSLNSCKKEEDIAPGESIELKIRNADPLTDDPVDNEPQLDPQDTVVLDPVDVDGGLLRCNETAYTASEVRQLVNMVGSDGTVGKIYPGSIIQGGRFKAGEFVEVTIPKVGGRLFLTGLSLDGSVVDREITVPEYSAGQVDSAISSYLANVGSGVQATTANFGLFIEETNSNEELYFHMGLDGRFKLNQVESQFNIEETRTGSLVTMQFTQIYYSVFINTPETMFSLFRDGADARDPENQIGPNNPPLYVSRVDYGRQIFFRAESTASTKDVKAILQAAIQKTPLDRIELESSLSASEVMEKTRIDYVVRGGSSEIALQNAANYEGVLNAIEEGAEWSLNNPAALVGYELNYLVDRSPAVMAFAADFVRKSCELDPPNVAVYEIKLDRLVCSDCEPFGEIEGGNAEFYGNAFIKTNQDPTEKGYNLSIENVPVNDGSRPYPSSRRHEFTYEGDGPRTITVRGTLTEDDPTNDDSFGQESRTINMQVFDDNGGGGEFSLLFERGSGGSYQRARVYFVVDRLQ
jgi:hypothetical protein